MAAKSGFTETERRQIVDTFNSRNFTFGGAPVRATGISKDYPVVQVRRGHPLFGFGCEYSWGTLLNICNGSKTEIAVAP